MHEVQLPPHPVQRIEIPATLEEALAVLARLGARARPLAGGTDLFLELRRRQRPGVEVLVDLTAIAGLDRVAVEESGVHLGPLVTHGGVATHPDLRDVALPLVQACLEVGSPPLRTTATVVGNVVTASPANDTISALLALDAVVEIASVRGTRVVPLERFHLGVRRNDLAADELVVGIRFPALVPPRRGMFLKLGLRAAQAISVVHAALVVELDGDEVVDARVALGSVAPTVVRSPEAEAVLVGARLDAPSIAEAARLAAASVEPIDDLRATAAYRRHMVAVTVRRALETLRDGREAETLPARPTGLLGGGDPPRPAAALDGPTPVEAVVDGHPVRAPARPDMRLLDWLREEAGPAIGRALTGTKEGCGEGECGACTVLLDGAAVLSCLVPAHRAHGREVVTVAGLAGPDGLHPVQEAFVDVDAVQCGYCTPGFVVTAARLLDEIPDPEPAEVRAALAGNLCRCTGYDSIVEAVLRAAGTSS